MAEHDQRGEYLGERGSSVESESVPSRPTLTAREGQAAASPPPTEQAAAVVPLQAGMTNPELALAWVSKVPGVKPTDEELRAFALGAEVGFARALSAAAPVVVQPADALGAPASPSGSALQPPAAASAAIPGADHAQLMRFYAVDTLPALIDAQARHIEKLQAKLPPSPSLAPQRVREG